MSNEDYSVQPVPDKIGDQSAEQEISNTIESS